MQSQARLLSTAVLAALAVSASASAVAAKSDSPAALRAQGLIEGNNAAVQRAAEDRFTVKDVAIDRDDTEHVRFDRSYRGLPVIGGDMVVHSKNGQFKSASLTLKTKGRPDLVPQIDADRAVVEAGTAFGTGFNGVPSAKLVVYARDLAPTLAYEVVMKGTKRDQTMTEMHYFVDARNGKVLDGWDMVHTAASAGTGKTTTLGDVGITTDSTATGFQMIDPSRGNGSTYDAHQASVSAAAGGATLFTDSDNTWGNNSTSDRKRAVSFLAGQDDIERNFCSATCLAPAAAASISRHSVGLRQCA